ncbi:hypothetical protein HDU76_005373, partial [Blyttiomyces sp. JEL0837]
FNLGSQKLICEKWATQNKPTRINTVTVMTSTPNQDDQNESPGNLIVPTNPNVITRIITATQAAPGSMQTGTGIPPVPSATSKQSASLTNILMPTLVSSGIITAMLILVFVWYVHRRDRSKMKEKANEATRNERSVTEQNNNTVTILSTANGDPPNDAEEPRPGPTPILSDQKTMNDSDDPVPILMT